MREQDESVQFGFVWKDDGYPLVVKLGLLEHASFSSMIFQQMPISFGDFAHGTAGPNLCPKVDAGCSLNPADRFWFQLPGILAQLISLGISKM